MDLLPYLQGDGRAYSVRYTWGGGGNQVMQTQVAGAYFHQVKWQQWEQFFADDGWIYRTVDTSPGGSEVYELRDVGRTIGSRWCKRHMAVSEVCERFPRILWYDKTTGAFKKEDRHQTWLRLERHHPSWTSANGFSASDVIELGWYLDAGLSQRAETYWYGKHYGLIGWQGGPGRSSIESTFPTPPVLNREALSWYVAPPDPLNALWLLNPASKFRHTTVNGGRFNDPRTYANKKHEGRDFAPLDVNAPSPVVAAQTGTVTKVGNDPGGYGDYIRIDHDWHGKRYVTWYGHLSRRDVREGQRVNVGDVIGETGVSGNVTGEHLHLTLQDPALQNDYSVTGAIDPERYLRETIPADAPPVVVPEPEAPSVDFATAAELQQAAMLHGDIARLYETWARRLETAVSDQPSAFS